MALVGASARPGSLGARMIEEVARSPSRPRTYLVNPRYADINGVPCLPSLAEVPEPVDLALLAVPDSALQAQLDAAARTRARSAVIFGSAFDLPSGRPGLRRAAGRDGQGSGHGGVRRGVHGVRERRPRAAGRRLHRARPAPGAGRAGHPLGFGVLRAAAGAPRLRLQPGRLVRPGTRHHRRGLRQVRARPAGDPGAGPGPRGDQGRGRAAFGAGGRAGRRRAGGAAQRGHVGGRDGAGVGPLRGAGRG